MGDQVKFSDKRTIPTLLYADKTGYYLWSFEDGGIFSSKYTAFLDKLDNKFNLVSSKEFLASEKISAVKVQNILTISSFGSLQKEIRKKKE
ncbi:MAG TPA: hypothetical protein PKD16_18185 [Saprospiraceae bacterium]|nr:hypothetical protein [Saprospiraceae bacterium]HMT72104.1 hypothetical protein [Saprospiraceae bacterium]